MSPEEEKDPAFEKLLQYLKDGRGFDFTDYKRASLVRRVKKRMGEIGIKEFEEYEDYLEVHPQEFTNLFNTILINVTTFFRDRAAWDYLAEEIVPAILEAKTPSATIRLWSAGCASGEEAYSLAILMAEALGLDASRHRVKIYATDVDDDALDYARKGVYNREHLEDLPEILRKKYFQSADKDGHSVFRQDLRRTLVFGRHDLIQDAPISRLDLLMCRNALIYFNREAQERIVSRFHFALRDSGYLFLGRAETMLSHADLFEPVDLKHRIFRRIPLQKPREAMEVLLNADAGKQNAEQDSRFQLQRSAFDASPLARVLIDRQGYLVLANEMARARLGLDPRDLGRPFHDLEISYRPLELRSLIKQAREERSPVVTRNVKHTWGDDDSLKYLDVTVIPLRGADGRWLGTEISFADFTERQEHKAELKQVRQDLETAHEELQSTNEELETSNEELQSTNEEMETMNEELQSSNAELQTMNEQLRHRTIELKLANAFLESILASVEVAVVVIDREFKVTLWNERAEDLWGLRSNEVVDRSLLELDIGLPVKKLKEPVERFLAGEIKDEKIELEAVNRRGKTIRCYVTRTVRLDEGGEPEGVVLMMEEARA